MTFSTTLQDDHRRASPSASGPSVVGLGRGWGAGSGVVVARRPGAHRRPRPPRRRGHRHLRRRPHAPRRAWPASTPTPTWPSSRSTPATPRPVDWAPTAAPGARRRRSSPSPTPAAAACASRSGFVTAAERTSAARAAAASPARSSTPRRSRAARPAARSSTPTGRLLGPQRHPPRRRPDPRRARRRGAARARRGARRAASAPSRPRLGVALAPAARRPAHAPRRRPARARRPARPRRPRRLARAERPRGDLILSELTRCTRDRLRRPIVDLESCCGTEELTLDRGLRRPRACSASRA